MVVFPALSSPRIKTRTSLRPQRDEKRVLKKTPIAALAGGKTGTIHEQTRGWREAPRGRPAQASLAVHGTITGSQREIRKFCAVNCVNQILHNGVVEPLKRRHPRCF